MIALVSTHYPRTNVLNLIILVLTSSTYNHVTMTIQNFNPFIIWFHLIPTLPIGFVHYSIVALTDQYGFLHIHKFGKELLFVASR